MVKFTRILAPVTIERILDVDPTRIYLEFREDQNLGYWINTKNTDEDTCLILNNELPLSNKRDGVDCTQEYFAFRNAPAAVIQIVEDFKEQEKTKQPTREAPIMDIDSHVHKEEGILQSTWEWLFN